MPTRSKRFYLCNLIPLWEIDESDMDVDWPVYHAYFGDLVEMRAEIRKRKVKTDGLKVRFEVYESDFLLSGGLNDEMGVFSTDAGFGDDAAVRPLKVVEDLDAVALEDREKFTFAQRKDPETLLLRSWWKVADPKGGDVSGNPEFYYDVFVEGKLEDGKDVDLEERSDHELEGMAWHVTETPRMGRATSLVDGEYAYLAMLRLLEGAQHSIHILNWKLDPQATLVVEHEFRADYLQVPDLDKKGFDALLVACKPRVLGVDARGGGLLYVASNGNLVNARSDGSEMAPAMRELDAPTSVDLPSGVQVLDVVDFPALARDDGSVIPAAAGVATAALVLDQLRSRLHLYLVLERARAVGPIAKGLFALVVAAPAAGRPAEVLPFFELDPPHPAIADRGSALIAGLVPLAGDGNVGFRDDGLALQAHGRGGEQINLRIPVGKLNRPTDVLVADKTLFVSDTANHAIRVINGFDPADLGTTVTTNPMKLVTLAGHPITGDKDATGDAARFREPRGLAWDTLGTRLIVADTGNRKLRAVNRSTGAVTTLAVTRIDDAPGQLGEVAGLAFDAAAGKKGTVYVAERDRHRILAVDLDTLTARTLAGSRTGEKGDAGGAVAAARFHRPLDLSLDGTTLFVADSENRVVRAIDLTASTVTTLGSRDTAGAHDVPVILADVLGRKAAAGVEVRALLDGIGSGISRESVGGGAFVSISGPQTAADLRHYDRSIQAFVQDHVERLEEGFFGMDRGQTLASNHDKMMVVDGRAGVTGGIDFDPGRNDGLLHARDHRNSMPWHDVATLVEGKIAHDLDIHFVRRWKLLRDELFKQDAEEREEREPPNILGVVADFKLPVRHYESQRLVLDGSKSSAGAFRSIVEYRWEILRRFPKGNAFEEVFEGRTTVTDASVQLTRQLDAGQYKVKLTVKSETGGEASTDRLLDVLAAPPDLHEPVDRTDPAIAEHPVESVRTWDPSPVFLSLGAEDVKEILESYKRAIAVARHYIFMEHQYIYWPEIGEFLESAMKDHPQLQVIWVIPLFTEETTDPHQERAAHQRAKGLATTIFDTAEFTRAAQAGLGATQGQLKSQLSWHGFFRQHEMVEKMRKVDPKRFGVFSIPQLAPSDDGQTLEMEAIYPHSKMILCDDRFFSIGSANANGRGFVTDGEHNVSALSPRRGKELRDRLWGEHLGYLGLAATVRDTGSGDVWLVPTHGHHLAPGDRMRFRHQDTGDVERRVVAVHGPSGAIKLDGAPLDAALRAVYWRDPRLEELRPQDALTFWRAAAHSLATGRVLKGLRARTNAAGALIVPGNLAEADDVISFGYRLLPLDEAGKARSPEPVFQDSVRGIMKVASVSGEAITLVPQEGEVPDTGPWAALAIDAFRDERPFRLTVKGRSGGKVKVKVGLIPNLTDVPFDYQPSWMARQPGAIRGVRAWEIDPPEGIEYAGPGSLLFSPWFVIPRLLFRFDPDEQVRLDVNEDDVRVA